MIGETIPQIPANLATLLNIHLRDKKCQILVSDAYVVMPNRSVYDYIDSDRPSVENFHKNERQNWELIHVYSDELNFDNFDPEVELTKIDLRPARSSLYENIEF